MATKKTSKAANGKSKSAQKLARREVRARSFELPIWLDDALRAKNKEGVNVSKFLTLQAEALVKGDGVIVDEITLALYTAARNLVNSATGKMPKSAIDPKRAKKAAKK
jgi:hypothetical protein